MLDIPEAGGENQVKLSFLLSCDPQFIITVHYIDIEGFSYCICRLDVTRLLGSVSCIQ